MAATDIRLTMLVMTVVPVFLLITRLFGRLLQAATRDRLAASADMNAFLTERLSAPGAQLVHLYGDLDVEGATFAAKAAQVRELSIRTTVLTAVVGLLVGMASYAATSAALPVGRADGDLGRTDDRHPRAVRRVRRPRLRTAQRAHPHPGRSHDGDGVVRAGLRSPALPERDHRPAGRDRPRASRGRVEFRDVSMAHPTRPMSPWRNSRTRRIAVARPPARPRRCSTTCRSSPSRGRRSPSSGRPGRARRPRCTWCRGCSMSPTAPCWSTATTSATSR